jgi:hypothetical protein
MICKFLLKLNIKKIKWKNEVTDNLTIVNLPLTEQYEASPGTARKVRV